MPMPATGSKSQKFKMSARACTSIQRIEGSTAMRSMIAMDLAAPRMQPDARHQRARRQQHDARAVAAQIGIELQRARHHGRRGDAAAAVADDDDLVGGIGARDLDEAMRAGLDAAVEAGRLAARVFQEIRPMAVDLHHEEAVGQRTQQLEAGERRRDADDDAERERHVERTASPAKRSASRPIRTSTSHQSSMHLERRQREAVLTARRGRCGTACR